MPEQWRDIREWSVSDLGRVMKAGRLITPYVIEDHLYVCKPGGGHQGVARLILEAFVGPPGDLWALHWDDNPANNQLNNLRWGTREENAIDSVRNGTHVQARKTCCPKGHEYTPENTSHSTNAKGTYRRCLKCSRDDCRRRRAAA